MSESTNNQAAELFAAQVAIEQAHVDKVYRYLAKATTDAKNIAAESRARFISDRDDWLREEAGTALFERDAFAYQAAKRLAVLDTQHEGLVFGRLDFSADDEKRYIGRLGVRDDDYEPLVIDWRAPAAEAFYRATGRDPMGVTRRRILHCRDDLVVGIEDELLADDPNGDLVVIGEGALLAALNRSRGSYMRDIVATIQAEQDEAIRAPHKGVTVISGGPGTGKTVVALHRAAYLLYSNRKRLQQGGVLVVGPTDTFMGYIERVLPGLGEDSVTLKSVGNLAADALGFGSSKAEDRDAALLKGSLRMLPVLRRLVREPLSPPSLSLKVSVKGEILTLKPAELDQIRRQVLSNNRLNQARETAETALLDALWQQLSHDVAAVLDLDREIFDDIVTSQANWVMFCNAWWPNVSAETALARLADPILLHKVAKDVFTSEEEEILADSLTHARGYQSGSGLPHPDWSISDIALLDQLHALMGPVRQEEADDQSLVWVEGGEDQELVTLADKLSFQREILSNEPVITYAHVLVDESQDITPMQWKMLRRRGPQASWTLVGDPAQSSFPLVNETGQALKELVGSGQYRTFKLTKNYRSPAEVMQLAGEVIKQVEPNADLPEPVRATGNYPELHTVRSNQLTPVLGEKLIELAGRVEGSIAIIAPPGRFASLRDTVATMALPDQLAKRLSVLTALESKGLEYDGVIVVSPDEIVAQTPGGLRVLYVALTRPTQRLVVLDVNPGARIGDWRAELVWPPAN